MATDQVIKSRTKAAQDIEANLDSMCSSSTRNFVTAYAQLLGCPREFLLFPLLSIIASFMGTSACIRFNSFWVEPAILWLIVCARKGEAKSPAGRILRKGISELEASLQDKFTLENPEASTDELPRLTVNHFSFEKLHQVMKRNNGNVLGFFDEMTLLYDTIQHSKGKSNVDRKIFLSLNGGDAWERDFQQTGSSVIHKTCLNIVGFIQPKYVVQLLATDDADGFNDRQLFSCPSEVKTYPDELKELPNRTPTCKAVYELVYHRHVDKSTGKQPF